MFKHSKWAPLPAAAQRALLPQQMHGGCREAAL